MRGVLREAAVWILAPRVWLPGTLGEEDVSRPVRQHVHATVSCARSARWQKLDQGFVDPAAGRHRGRWYRRNDARYRPRYRSEPKPLSAVRDLVDRGVIGFVGGLVSDASLALAPEAASDEIMEVSPASTAPQLSTAGQANGRNSSPERSRATGHRRR